MANKKLYEFVWGLAACAVLLSGCGGGDGSLGSVSTEAAESVRPKPLASVSLSGCDVDAVSWYNMDEPSFVPVSAMGELLCDATLSNGAEVVCYWEPNTEYTKYWAIRQGDMLLRFCQEESGYKSSYTISEYTNVLGHDGFRIECPRGAAYQAYDYYYWDENGMPCLLAAAAADLLEEDVNDDGTKELFTFYHGGRDISYIFQDSMGVREAAVSELLQLDFPGYQVSGTAESGLMDGGIPATLWMTDQNMESISVLLRFTIDTMEVWPASEAN